MLGTGTFLTACLLLAAVPSVAASFNDVFNSDLGQIGRKPFMWWIPGGAPGGPAAWEVRDSVLDYRTEDADLGPAIIQQ